jgi:hypothetical protein
MATTATQVMESVERMGIDYRLGKIIEDVLAAHDAPAQVRRDRLFEAGRRAESYARNVWPEDEGAESAALVLDLPTATATAPAKPAKEKPFQAGKKPFAGKPGRKPALPAKTATPTPASLAGQRRCKACGTPKDPRAFQGGRDVCTACQNKGKTVPAAKPANGTNGAGKAALEIPLTAEQVQEYHSVSDVPHKRRALTVMERNNAPVCRLIGPNGAVVAVLHRADLDREFSEPEDIKGSGDE